MYFVHGKLCPSYGSQMEKTREHIVSLKTIWYRLDNNRVPTWWELDNNRVSTRYWKYWISKVVFKTLKKYWILPKCILGI